MTTKTVTTTLLLVSLAIMSGCGGGGLKISPGAVHEIAGVAENPGLKSLTLSSDEVGQLARQAGVDDQVVREVAPDLDSTSIWSGSVQGVQRVYEQTPSQVRSNLIGVACDGLNGGIKSPADLANNILERVRVESQGELASYVASVSGLWQELYDARTSADPQRKAAAALTCFAVEHAVG